MTFAELGAFLNVIIIVILVALVMSIVSSAIVEAIAGALGARGKMLRQRILSFFDDIDGIGFGALVIEQPLIKSLGEEKRFPSYIPRDVFASAVEAAFRDARGRGSRHTPPILLNLMDDPDGADTDLFRKKVGDWYDEAMARLSGSYRRSAHFKLFITGLVLAAVFNVSMLSVASTLWSNRFNLDTSVVKLAAIQEEILAVKEKTGESNLTTILKQNDEFSTRISEVLSSDIGVPKIPVGRVMDLDCEESTKECKNVLWRGVQAFFASDWTFANIIGWLVTALLVLPGAQFWFDALGKTLSLRATGPKPGTDA